MFGNELAGEAEAKILFIAPNNSSNCATCTAFNGTGFVAIVKNGNVFTHKECSQQPL
jgi:hypothetical protein